MSEVKKIVRDSEYKKFNSIDGSHPLKKVVPHGYIDYQARTRKGGKVSYFNFDLAKEMGLIAKSHDSKLNPELCEKILDVFSIQIINEYDLENNKKFPANEMKAGTYMATRYLQLQHDDKKGRTSGDGRSIWNGIVRHNNKIWDVSSCGTGGTRLSPATSKYNKFFETGDPSISYGCGYAEFDEGLATAILSKIFQANEHSTEEVLGIIEFADNISINIRVHQNLIRPSHLFLFLKQDDLEGLTSIVDYYIERQRSNSEWSDCPKGKKKYDYLLQKFVQDFACLSANFEDEYIFCWLDWDGDNILMDSGIIDYGSIRQFGLFHYEYRYDDVERFSSNLIQQKNKAKYIVQTMLQAVEYIKSSTKPNIQELSNHELLDQFETVYQDRKNQNILHRIGLTQRKANQFLKREPELVLNFRKTFSYFEQIKSSKGEVKISDGVTWDAIFSMRDLLREFPQVYALTEEKLSDEEFMEVIASSLASKKDLELNQYRKQKIADFQNQYLKIVEEVSNLFQEPFNKSLESIAHRSLIINKSSRVTGDAVTHIVDLVSKQRPRLTSEELNEFIAAIVASQNLNPDEIVKYPQSSPDKLVRKALDLIYECREGI